MELMAKQCWVVRKTGTGDYWCKEDFSEDYWTTPEEATRFETQEEAEREARLLIGWSVSLESVEIELTVKQMRASIVARPTHRKP